MNTKFVVGLLGALAIGSPQLIAPASARPADPLVITTSASDTVAFLGFQWNFGSKAPELVLGARYTQSDAENSLLGAKLDLAFPLDSAKWTTPTLRLMGVDGGCNVQGELGLGMSFADTKPFVAAGIQGPYVNGGVDLGFDGRYAPYLGLSSLAAPSCATQRTSVIN